MMENRFMTKGKVVLLPFPFDDLSTLKVRPAVWLTNPIGLHRHVAVAFLTSRIPTDLLETDIVLTYKIEISLRQVCGFLQRSDCIV
jgi:mRNA interferase MazF